MAWIELHQSVWDHKKTLILAAELDLENIIAAAHMAKLWTWALDNAPDGVLSGLPYKVISIGAGWKGDPDQFVNAAVKAGYIDSNDAGLILHDWYDYAGRLIEKREAERDRSRKRRALEKGSLVDSPTTNGRPLVDQQTTVGTVPNRTVPNLKNNPPTPLKIIKTKFAEFVSLTNDEYSSLVAKLGEERAKRCIEILDNYKGAKGTRYKSDYRAILNWVVKRLEEEEQKKPPPGGHSKFEALEAWANE